MSAAPAPRAAGARYTPAATDPAQAERERLAAALFDRVLCGTPRRAAPMTLDPKNKYRDKIGHTFTPADVLDHLHGRRTWATTLQNSAGQTVTAARDYDAATEAAMWAALDAARAAGIRGAAAFLMPGDDDQHYGGHVLWHYSAPVSALDAGAQVATVLPKGAGEIFPSGQCLRFPFGYHRQKGTRGQLLMLGPAGERLRWRLDNGAELVAGIRAYLAAPCNGAPPEAPPKLRERLAAGVFGAAYDPAHWESLSENLGGRYMAAARYRRYCHNPNRPQLHTLLTGGRVVTTRPDGTPDDSDSAQVAVAVNNLITVAHRHPSGTLVPGYGAPPEDEIRAVMLWFKPKLRPNTSDEHYRAQVDYEIARYRPASYAPEATRHLPAEGVPLPEGPRAEATHRGRPAGQRAAQAAQLLDLLAARIGQDVKLDDLGQLLDNPVSGRMVAAYLDDLGNAVTLRRGRYGLRVEAVRSEIKSPEGPAEQPAQVAEQIGNPTATEGPAQRIPARQNDNAGAHMEEHTAACGPVPCPAPAAGAAAPRPALGLAELVADALDQRKGSRLARVVDYVRRNGGECYAEAAIKRAAEAERKRRRYARADERDRQRYAALDLAALQKKRGNAERRIAEGLAPLLPAMPPADFRADLPDAERRERWQQKRAARIKDRRALVPWQKKHAAIEAAIADKLPRVTEEAEQAAMLADLDAQREKAARRSGPRPVAPRPARPATAGDQARAQVEQPAAAPERASAGDTLIGSDHREITAEGPPAPAQVEQRGWAMIARLQQMREQRERVACAAD